MNAKRAESFRRCRADCRDLRIAKGTRVLPCMVKARKEMFHTVHARKDQPLIDMNVLDGVIQCRIAICRRSNADHGCLDAGCTKFRQLFRQCRCLCTCARHENMLAVQRANV